VQCRKFCRI